MIDINKYQEEEDIILSSSSSSKITNSNYNSNNTNTNTYNTNNTNTNANTSMNLNNNNMNNNNNNTNSSICTTTNNNNNNNNSSNKVNIDKKSDSIKAELQKYRLMKSKQMIKKDENNDGLISLNTNDKLQHNDMNQEHFNNNTNRRNLMIKDKVPLTDLLMHQANKEIISNEDDKFNKQIQNSTIKDKKSKVNQLEGPDIQINIKDKHNSHIVQEDNKSTKKSNDSINMLIANNTMPAKANNDMTSTKSSSFSDMKKSSMNDNKLTTIKNINTRKPSKTYCINSPTHNKDQINMPKLFGMSITPGATMNNIDEPRQNSIKKFMENISDSKLNEMPESGNMSHGGTKTPEKTNNSILATTSNTKTLSLMKKPPSSPIGANAKNVNIFSQTHKGKFGNFETQSNGSINTKKREFGEKKYSEIITSFEGSNSPSNLAHHYPFNTNESSSTIKNSKVMSGTSPKSIKSVCGVAKPGLTLSTPNSKYNSFFEQVRSGSTSHPGRSQRQAIKTARFNQTSGSMGKYRTSRTEATSRDLVDDFVSPRAVCEIEKTYEELENEVEKWKKFGKLMADSYDELNKKFSEFVKSQEKDKKIIQALKDQVTKLKTLLALKQDSDTMNNRDLLQFKLDELLSGCDNDIPSMNEQIEKLKNENIQLLEKVKIIQKEKDDEVAYFKKITEEKFKECTALAEEIICLRTDLDRTQSNYLKLQRDQANDNVNMENLKSSIHQIIPKKSKDLIKINNELNSPQKIPKAKSIREDNILESKPCISGNNTTLATRKNSAKGGINVKLENFDKSMIPKTSKSKDHASNNLNIDIEYDFLDKTPLPEKYLIIPSPVILSEN